MVEVLLTLIIIVLLAYIYLRDKQHDAQVNKLIKAVISKTPQDYRDLTLAENTRLEMENKPPLGPVNDDLVPMGGADDSLFDKMIQNQLNINTEDESSSSE